MADALPTRDDVERAAATIRGVVRRTPLLDAEALGAGISVKAELLQHAGSFKVRGVTNRLAALTPEERARGVIGVSAGNHAMALAWGAAREGLDCLVVMFRGASGYKLQRTQAFGATVEVVDGDPAGAFARMGEIVEATGRIVIHPFDDPRVVAGQGTVGLEIIEDAPGIDTVVVPTGGGGLVSGIAAAVAPSGVQVVAVEPERSAALGEAISAGAPVPVTPMTRAGGLDAPYAGTLAHALCIEHACAPSRSPTTRSKTRCEGFTRISSSPASRQPPQASPRCSSTPRRTAEQPLSSPEATWPPKPPLLSWPVHEGRDSSRVRPLARDLLVRQ
jgi:threonine dehydratase